MREHLKGAVRQFDGVVAVNDGVAFGVIRALTEAGLSVPKDVQSLALTTRMPAPTISLH
jgi:DNA-binding LacI/PurR family transcriptional regulator